MPCDYCDRDTDERRDCFRCSEQIRLCKQHYDRGAHRCQTCDGSFCSRHLISCYECRNKFCTKHSEKCAVCSKLFCDHDAPPRRHGCTDSSSKRKASEIARDTQTNSNSSLVGTSNTNVTCPQTTTTSTTTTSTTPPPLRITTDTLPDVRFLLSAPTDYDQTIAATGGTPPYTWALVSGNPPPGIAMDTQGRLTGRPLSAGVFNFRVRVTDSTGQTDEADLSIVSWGSGAASTRPTLQPNAAMKVARKPTSNAPDIRLEQSIGNRLAELGFKVEYNPIPKQDEDRLRDPFFDISTYKPEKNVPEQDFKIENQYFDCYSPNQATTTDAIWYNVKNKVPRQAQKIVINMENSANRPDEVDNKFQDFTMARLEELLVMDSNRHIIPLI